ncbi:MAG: metallophosphoesterase [Flavobacteriales bacterium]|nr:metallophosphoesterase [Flavobacteriales bacterium]
MAFLIIAVFVYSTTSYLAVNRDSYEENQFLMDYTIIGAITLSVTLLSISVFQLFADIALFTRIIRHRASGKRRSGVPLKRRVFLNKLSLGVGATIFGSFLWGLTKGKYGWRTIENILTFKRLPKSFHNTRIVQISDLHLGSFHENFEPLKEAVELINALEPDFIFFTGDLVNEDPEEARPWIDILKGLKAKKDKYAILGNHDYGWGRLTEEEKDKNSKGVLEILREMDFDVLANDSRILESQGEKIGLVGVENWGFSEQNWFPTRGDYSQATQDLEKVPFQILLSHDPTHWDHNILDKEPVDLTLSGHTHGGQMGIRIPGLLDISAGQLFYKRYAGLYSQGDQHLYVNRGLGYLIFPGRVGMPPEITLHILKSDKIPKA